MYDRRAHGRTPASEAVHTRACGASRESARGYLLIEALIALLLAAGLLSALVTFQLGLTRDGRLAAERSVASAYAEHGVESLLGRVRAGAASEGAGIDALPMTEPADPAEAPPSYWRRSSVTAIGGSMAIEVTVAWPDPDAGPLRRVRLLAAAQQAAAAESGRAAIGNGPVISP